MFKCLKRYRNMISRPRMLWMVFLCVYDDLNDTQRHHCSRVAGTRQRSTLSSSRYNRHIHSCVCKTCDDFCRAIWLLCVMQLQIVINCPCLLLYEKLLFCIHVSCTKAVIHDAKIALPEQFKEADIRRDARTFGDTYNQYKFTNSYETDGFVRQ